MRPVVCLIISAIQYLTILSATFLEKENIFFFLVKTSEFDSREESVVLLLLCKKVEMKNQKAK